jgi:putative FmdB family regulatory protein
MPIYEYDCPKCGRFEAMQKISEEPLVSKPDCSCADCPKAAMRAISASAFHLKGSGWYKTDYSSGGSSGGGKSSKESKTESASGSSESSDSGEKAAKPAGCGTSCGCH